MTFVILLGKVNEVVFPYLLYRCTNVVSVDKLRRLLSKLQPIKIFTTYLALG